MSSTGQSDLCILEMPWWLNPIFMARVLKKSCKLTNKCMQMSTMAIISKDFANILP